METMRRRSLTERMMGAAMLQADVYEEVEADTTATSQAAVVVAIVAVASAIGAAGGGIGAIIGALVSAFLGWLAWAAITYFVGEKVFGGTATWGELLRTLGFAQSPGVLYVLAFIPLLGGIIRFAIAIWILIAGIIAIRQALDFDTGKAVMTAIVGWLVLLVLTIIVGGIGSILT